MSIDLSNPIFHDEDAARGYFEGLHWPNGPICPHCGVVNEATALNGEAHRKGLYRCRPCGEQFRVTVKTVMESSHIPLHKWALAFRLMAGSKKGVSAHQLMRELGLGSYRTAWFLAHRVREAMADYNPEPLGGEGKTVEADETFIGRPAQIFKNGKGWVNKQEYHSKQKVVTLVERGGRSISLKVDDLSVNTIKQILVDRLAPGTTLNTDEAHWYGKAAREEGIAHETVNHSDKEYARHEGERLITSNTVEGFFGIFKRGMKGVYQHCGEQHLQAYLNEFDFRYSNRIALGVNDTERAAKAATHARGKRLMYQEPRSA